MHVKASNVEKYEIEHDLIILGIKGDAEIWYN